MTFPTPAALNEPNTANPANAPARAPARRIPMAVPTLKLAMPEIPGHVCHWFRGNPQRIQQALAAGYTFVNRDEVDVNSTGLANDYEGSGNTDLGSRVSVSAGEGEGTGALLYLMKIKKELWLEDELTVSQQQEQIAAQLRGDKGFSRGGDDTSHRYSRGENRNMFTPRRP